LADPIYVACGDHECENFVVFEEIILDFKKLPKCCENCQKIVREHGTCVVCGLPIYLSQAVTSFESKKYHEDCFEQEKLFKEIKEEIQKGKFKLAS